MPRKSKRAPWTIASFLLVIASVSLAASQPLAAEVENLRAVFTRVRGSVTLTVPQADARVRVARALQVIPRDAVITLPADSEAAIVCSNDYRVLLKGRSQWSLTAEACAQGRALSSDTYRRIAPRGGRQQAVGRLIVYERGSRGAGDDARIPVLLGPRRTMQEGRPILRWTAIPDATAYEIHLLGPRPVPVAHFAAGEVECAPGPDTPGEIRICTAAYPDWPELEPGKAYLLNVGARVGKAGTLFMRQYGDYLNRLSTGQATAVKEAVDGVESLPLGEATRQWMRARIYTEHKLYADAIAAYRHALSLESAAELQVSLADAYLLIGLPDLADAIYRTAGAASDDPAIAAAVAFGLGQVHLTSRRYREALEHFRRARDRYLELGLDDEAESAARQAAKAEERLPPKAPGSDDRELDDQASWSAQPGPPRSRRCPKGSSK